MAGLLLLLLPLLSTLLGSFASPQLTMGTGSSLSVEEHEQTFLTSPDATFASGFYPVGTNAFSFSIWFANTTDKTVVWTANRGSPVNGRGSKISLSHDGSLVLNDVNGSSVWDSKTSSGKGSTVALLDTGNLVIRDASNSIVWQSFNSPTDTLLPTQSLTKVKKLVSGSYSLYYDNDNVLRLMYDGPEISSIYWPNVDNTVFGNGRTKYNSSMTAVLDDMGRFVSSDGLNAQASDLGLGIKRRITIGQDGNLRMYSLNASNGSWMITWDAVPKMCDVHGLCGKNGICEYLPSLRCSCPPGHEMVDPENWSKGCRPTFSTNCSQGPEHFKFIKMPQTDFYGFDLGYNESVSFDYCKQLCLKSCSCVAFSYRLTGKGVCYPKALLFNGYKSSAFPGSLYLKVPSNLNISASSLFKQTGLTCKPNNSDTVLGTAAMYGQHKGSTNWTYFYVFAAALGALELLFIGTGWWFLSSKQNIPKSVKEGYKLMTSQFRRFTYRELREATGKFKEELGRGSSGIVYRGVLEEKKVVAVKKLTNVTQGEEEFWAEISVIRKINHINLVRIWGFCSEGNHKLLVYEYVENESLDKHLFDSTATKGLLGWSQRFKIALGTARGLAYLHHACLEWVVHCDVKPENILLTRDFEAKIADFGLAKLSRRDGPGFQFSQIRGTMGYMAPEWLLNLPINAKVDVYSYGAVLLEIVIGSRISSQTSANGEEMELGQIVQALEKVVASGDVTSIVDVKLNGQFNPQQAMEMVKISLSCLGERSKRPTMDEVVKALVACDQEDNHPS